MSLSQISQITLTTPLPHELYEVEQSFDASHIADVYQTTRSALAASGLLDRIQPGETVAIAVGSRGVANIPILARAAVDAVRERGGEPFITPSMGSHGGGTAEGQIEILAGLGVTEQAVGAPVRATMQTRQIGQIPGGPPLHQDEISASANHVLLIGRVKPHTDFHGRLESGLSKMLVIGLGKINGANEMHELGVKGFQTYLAPAARIYEANTNVLGGIAVVENAYDQTARIEVFAAAEIGTQRETELLEEARRRMASLPFKDIDVLVIREIGKNISGTGMDTNIIGKLAIPREPETPSPANIATIAVLDLTEATHGNAAGVGLANVTTLRVFNKVDFVASYTNALTSGIFGMMRDGMPILMADDRRAIQAVVRGCGKKAADARIAFIENTLRLERLWISPTLLPDAQAHPRLKVLDRVPLEFADGVMCSPWKLA